MKFGVAVALLAALASTAWGHRLDEYLQNTLVSVSGPRVHAEMTLTPGVAVFPVLAARIDTDGNGKVSPSEQRAYAAVVLRDLSFAVDGDPLKASVQSMRFPQISEMRAGRGEIRIDFEAELPRGGRNRKLSLANRHESRISAYLVNCLIPTDSRIHISSQHRNYTQSDYVLEFEDGEAATGFSHSGLMWLPPVALLLVARLGFVWRERLLP